jgi:hypothetical protein
MATLFDAIDLLAELGFYTVVFPFILVLALVYGVLSKVQPFGDNFAINITISTIVAFVFISFIKVSQFLFIFVPLVIAMLIVLVLLMLIFSFMNVPAESITKAFTSTTGYATIIGLILIFVFVSISAIYPQLAGGEAVGTGETTLGSAVTVLLSPTILGLVVLFIIFATVATMITYVPPKKT